MTDLTPRDHALRVAVLGAVLDTVKAEYAHARGEAEAAFAPLRADGQTQQKALLPDGSEVGLVSIKAGGTSVTADEAKLEAWVRKRVPDGMETAISPSALTDPEVIGMISACFPGLATSQVRPSVRAALLKEMEESGGKVADPETGEIGELGEVTHHKPTGAFSYRAAAGARDRIVSEWLAGRLAEIAFSPLALPTAEDARRPTDAAVAAMREALYKDEHGFLGPEAAAAHAYLVQGGYSTPPIEAYRMIRDGGTARERALAWLAEAGLDPADLREGKDTPWPLPERVTAGD
jgi:hypothetical protein